MILVWSLQLHEQALLNMLLGIVQGVCEGPIL